MSSHDILMTKLLELRSLMFEYIAEYESTEGEKAFRQLSDLMVTVNNFLLDDKNLK